MMSQALEGHGVRTMLVGSRAGSSLAAGMDDCVNALAACSGHFSSRDVDGGAGSSLAFKQA
jgi:hypothetical protein